MQGGPDGSSGVDVETGGGKPAKGARHEDLPALMWLEEATVEFMYRRPCTFMCTCLCTMFLLTLIVVGGGLMQFSEPSEFDWAVSDSDIVKQLDAIGNAFDSVDGVTGDTIRVRSVPSLDHSLVLAYSHVSGSTGSSIFTPQNVQTMCQLENLFLESPKYKDFCVLDNDSRCLPQAKSVMYYFYTPLNHSWGVGGFDCVLLNQVRVCGRQDSWCVTCPLHTHSSGPALLLCSCC